MKMHQTRQLTQNLINQFKHLGKFRYRSMFGGYGLCQNNIMFALIFDEKIYLKADHKLSKDFKKQGMYPLIFDKRGLPIPLGYYEITSSQWKDKQLVEHLIIQSLSNTIKNKDSNNPPQERIKNLPNITVSLERLLFKIGICDIQTLEQWGAILTYKKLKDIKHEISINILYILEAAITRRHVAVLTEQEKINLRLLVEKK